MKKYLSMILVFSVLFALSACGNASLGTPVETPPTNEEILKTAHALDLAEVSAAISENEINGQDTYYNKFYTMIGTVKSVKEDAVTLFPMGARFDTIYSPDFFPSSWCKVYMPREELKLLSKDDLIQVCGKLTEFSNHSKQYTLTMEDGFFVSDELTFSGKIEQINEYTSGKKNMVARHLFLNGIDYMGYNYYELPVDTAEYKKQAMLNGVTYYPDDPVTFTGTLKHDPSQGIGYFKVVNLKSIEKK